ncbi:MAG: hypothetical protein R2788_20300 [Saprospiraceae bacterium]
MKAIHFFHAGVGLNLFILLLAISNYIECAKFLPEYTERYVQGGLVVLLFFSGLLGVAFWLKKHDKMLVANVLVWIPALPLLFVAGLALLFILFGK